MLSHGTLSGLTGLLLLLSGTAAGASDKQPADPPAEQIAAAEAEKQAESEQAEKTSDKPRRTERIVVSLPSGRRYVIEREVKDDGKPSSSPIRTTRLLNDGSRINYGMTGPSGRSSAARSKSGGKTSSAGRATANTGGRNAASSTASRSGSSGGGSSASSGGGGGGGGGGSARAASSGGGGGGMNLGTLPGSRAKAPASQSGPSVSGPAKTVPTIGNPRYSDDGATGGQDVVFHEAGISAMVVGRMVYIWGAEIVQSSQDFQLVEGERFAFDGAVVRLEKQPIGNQTLTSAEMLQAPLKLEYAPGSTVTLTMFSKAQNPELPDREIRNWTFRVR